MKLLSFLLLLQYNRRQKMESDFQTMMLVGYFIGGMILTRVISGVIVLILGFTVLRGKRVLAVVISHAITFAFCAVGLWAMLSTPRSSGSVPTSQGSMNYTESSEYPFVHLLIYAVCIFIWFVIDFVIAKSFDNHAKRKAESIQTPKFKVNYQTKTQIK